MHIMAQEKYMLSGLAEQAALTNQYRVIKRTIYYPNYCFDCNRTFFNHSFCPYCGSENIHDLKPTRKSNVQVG